VRSGDVFHEGAVDDFKVSIARLRIHIGDLHTESADLPKSIQRNCLGRRKRQDAQNHGRYPSAPARDVPFEQAVADDCRLERVHSDSACTPVTRRAIRTEPHRKLFAQMSDK
jgi:hypothetical protein